MYLGHILWKPTHTHVKFVTQETAEVGRRHSCGDNGESSGNEQGRAADFEWSVEQRGIEAIDGGK